MKHRHAVVPLLFLSLLSLAPAAMGRTVWFVDGAHGNDGNNCKSRKTACQTIGHAISLAPSGSVILVAPAIYNENLLINSNLEIIGAGPNATIIDGQGLDTVVFIPDKNTHVVLAGLAIRSGYASYTTGGRGGGIANWGTLVVFDTNVYRNTAGDINADDGAGAGISNGGTLTLSHSTVSENQTILSYFSFGGGISNSGMMRIDDSTVNGNSSSTTDVYGSGIYNGGTLVMNRTTLNGNDKGGGYFGGGLYNDYLATATVSNSTLYGNTSDYLGVGGVINGGTLSINNSTVSGNIGGGISNGATVILQNSIVADNGGNCYGTMTSNGCNLSNDDTCIFTGPGDLNNIEPKLGSLRNNGGSTQTIAELPGSPTIDAGNPQGCTDNQGHPLKTDQRGFPRPGRHDQGNRCDIGAFERQKN